MILQNQSLLRSSRPLWIPFIGKYSLIKVCSGVIKNDDALYNVTKETEENSVNCMCLKEAALLRFGASCRRYQSYRKTGCEDGRYPFFQE